MELEFVDCGDIEFDFQHRNAGDPLTQIQATVEYVRLVICELDFQHLVDEIICRERIIREFCKFALMDAESKWSEPLKAYVKLIDGRTLPNVGNVGNVATCNVRHVGRCGAS